MRSLIIGSLVALAFVTATPRAQSNLTGTWAVSFTTPQGNMDATATFKQDGEALSGTMSGPQGEVPFKGIVKGKTFTFTIDVESPNGQLVIKLDGEQDGDSIKGTFDFGQGTGDWVGKRNK
jgi:hypothetical protein